MSNINILAGANSSGKSTVIQSILLLKQTVQYGSPERSVALNGPLLRMGEFTDIRNFEAEGANVGIEFELAPDNENAFGSLGRSGVRSFVTSELADVASLAVEMELGQVYAQDIDGAAKSQLELKHTNIRVKFNNSEGREPLYYSLVANTKDDPNLISGLLPYDHYEARIDYFSKEQLEATRPKLEVKGGSTRHFLPDYILLRYDAAAQRAAELAAFMSSNSASMLTRGNIGEEVIPPAVVSAINEWLSKKKAALLDIRTPITANQIRHRLAPFLYGGTGQRLSSLIIRSDKSRADEAILRTLLAEALVANTEAKLTYDLDTPRSLKAGSDYVREYFRQGIRYLGPLRDAPRPVYPLEALESTTDVGYRGEHTAAVFQLNSEKSVHCHLPPDENFDGDFLAYARHERLTLHDAAVRWLGYLGVAEEVKATDSGVFGNRLQVSTGNKDRWHDLTNVGVGVSQVLPLVVTSLLAPVGSLLIFEQPELHLHPRVQARLADFFLALALDGKQMLLETHSEYLIDRLRLRIALSDKETAREMVNILFTEKQDAESRISPVEVSEYGAISNWPKDFFDQSQKDVARLLKAAAAKRAKKSHR